MSEGQAGAENAMMTAAAAETAKIREEGWAFVACRACLPRVNASEVGPGGRGGWVQRSATFVPPMYENVSALCANSTASHDCMSRHASATPAGSLHRIE